MEKAVMLNLSSRECESIAISPIITTGLLRNSKPNIPTPFKVFVHCSKGGLHIFGNDKVYVTDSLKILGPNGSKDAERTSGLRLWNGRVIGEFVCNEIIPVEDSQGKSVYEWAISKFKAYKTPKEIGEFFAPCDGVCNKCKYFEEDEVGAYEHTKTITSCFNFLTKAPINWCYVAVHSFSNL